MTTRSLMTTLKKLFFQYDWEIVEIQGAMFKVMWGLWLLLPFDTFAGIDVYNSLKHIASETGWGLTVMTLGILHIISIASGKIFWRRILLILACMFWIFIAIIFALSRIGSALIPLTLVIAFFMGVNYLRLGIPFTINKKQTKK